MCRKTFKKPTVAQQCGIVYTETPKHPWMLNDFCTICRRIVPVLEGFMVVAGQDDEDLFAI
jgi:hypothetical protein